MTVHKEGRRQIPVQVNVNRQEETITAIPRSLHPHDNLETFFDFKLVIFGLLLRHWVFQLAHSDFFFFAISPCRVLPSIGRRTKPNATWNFSRISPSKRPPSRWNNRRASSSAGFPIRFSSPTFLLRSLRYLTSALIGHSSVNDLIALLQSEWVGADRLKEFCNGRQIYQLVSKPEIDGREAEIKSESRKINHKKWQGCNWFFFCFST